MKKFLILVVILVSAMQMLPAQEEAEGSVIPEGQVSITPDEARELILFDNNGFIFGAYVRVGLNQNSSANMVEGVGWWNVENGYNGMRFMNEGNYSEWLFAYESPRDDPDWWGGAYLRVAYDIPEFGQAWDNLSGNDYGIILPEAFFRLGFGSQKWNFWIGRRYNEKVAVNMMDYYIANLDGNGIGMEGIEIGAATLDINWLYSYDNGDPVGSNGDDSAGLFTYPGKNTLGFVIRGLPAGRGHFSFIIAPSFQSGGDVVDTVDGTGNVSTTKSYPYGGGAFGTMQYRVPHFLGLDGQSDVYASVGFGTGSNQSADTDIDDYAIDDYSVFAGVQGFALLTDTISWRATLHYEHRAYEPTEKNFMSLGFRPLFRVAPIFGIQLEYDFEAAFDTGKYVNRFTFAPTFLPKNGDTTSPLQVMAYVTYGYGDFAGGDNIAISPGSKHGFTWGVSGNVGF